MGGGDPSWSECRDCGVHQHGAFPSSPLIDPPAVRAELGQPASSEPSGAVLEGNFPLTRPANYSDFHPLEQPPSAPVLVAQGAPNEIPTTTPEPTPTLIAASHQEQAVPAARTLYMGESSAPPPPPPLQSPDNEVPIQKQRVDIERSDYPPPGHRPFGGEDLRRRNMWRPFPAGNSHDQGRGYEYISLISDLGRRRCRQYYPNDHYLNNRPWYRRVDIWNSGHNNCELPRTRIRARERGPAASCFPDGAAEGSNYVVPPLRRWNTCPVTFREPPASNSSFPPRENDDHQDDQPAEGPGPSNPPRRQPTGDQGTVVQDNIVIGDASRVRIGEGNRGGRSTGGRVTGNVVVR